MRKSIFIVSFCAIVGALAYVMVPVYSYNRISAHSGGSAVATMKGDIFAGQVTFQSQCFIDVNKNGIGEYGYIRHMAGLEEIQGNIDAKDIKIITGSLANPVNIYPETWVDKVSGLFTTFIEDVDAVYAQGYYFKVFLPNGRGGMYGLSAYRDDRQKIDGAHLRENYYVIIAWPREYKKMGGRVYAMTQDGEVRSANSLAFTTEFAAHPSWQAVFDRVPGNFEQVLKHGPNDNWIIKDK